MENELELKWRRIQQAMRQEVPIVQEDDDAPLRGPAEQLEYQRAMEKNVHAAVIAQSARQNAKSKAVNVLSDKARRAAAMEAAENIKTGCLPGKRSF